MKAVCIALVLALAQYSSGSPLFFGLPPVDERIVEEYLERDPRIDLRRIRLGEEPLDILPFDRELRDMRFLEMYPEIIDFPQYIIDRFDRPEPFRPFKRVTTVEEFIVEKPMPIDDTIVVPVIPVVPEKVEPPTTNVVDQLKDVTTALSKVAVEAVNETKVKQ